MTISESHPFAARTMQWPKNSTEIDCVPLCKWLRVLVHEIQFISMLDSLNYFVHTNGHLLHPYASKQELMKCRPGQSFNLHHAHTHTHTHTPSHTNAEQEEKLVRTYILSMLRELRDFLVQTEKSHPNDTH